MPSIRTRYAEVVRAAKAQINAAIAACKADGSPEAMQELRIIQIFQRRAREEFRVLGRQKKSQPLG